MSADNWAVCPNCSAMDARAKQDLADEIRGAYGVISIEAHDELRARLANWREIEPSFREDYEIYGADTGAVTVTYWGACVESVAEQRLRVARQDRRGCGAHLEFTHSYPIAMP